MIFCGNINNNKVEWRLIGALFHIFLVFCIQKKLIIFVVGCDLMPGDTGQAAVPPGIYPPFVKGQEGREPCDLKGRRGG